MVVVRLRDTVKGVCGCFFLGLQVQGGLRGDGEEGLMVRSVGLGGWVFWGGGMMESLFG